MVSKTVSGGSTPPRRARSDSRADDPVRGPIPQDSGAGGESRPRIGAYHRLRGPADRAPASGAGGHGFESRRRHQARTVTLSLPRQRETRIPVRATCPGIVQRSAFRPPMPAVRVRIPSGTPLRPRIPNGRGSGLKIRAVWVRIPPGAQGSTSSAVNGVEWRPDPSRGSRDAVMESSGTDTMTCSHGRRRRVTPSPAREGCRPIG